MRYLSGYRLGLLSITVLSWGMAPPLASAWRLQTVQTQETLPKDQPRQHEPTVPRQDTPPTPDPEPEPLVPQAHDSEGLGQPIVPRPAEPGLPAPPMPQPAEPGLPEPPTPQPAEPAPLDKLLTPPEV